MTPDELKNRVRQDLTASPAYETDIEKQLVTPTTGVFESFDHGDLTLWIVGKKEEYFITFSEATGEYGIAFRNIIGNLVSLGDDGSLADAWETLVAREEESGDHHRHGSGKGRSGKPRFNRR